MSQVEAPMPPMPPIAPIAVILAAGQGTRMRSNLPKVLHRAAGRPLLAWVLAAARAAGCERRIVIVGHGADEVRKAFAEEPDLEFVLQAEQRGTGHALAQVAPLLGNVRGTILVLSGDVPLLLPETLRALLATAARGFGALAVAELEDAGGLGRVFANAAGNLERIVEVRDATPEERAHRLGNAGIYALPAPAIFDFLARLEPNNAQGELYLTDAVSDAARGGESLVLHRLADAAEGWGVNTRGELALVHRRLLDRTAAHLLADGVAILEPARTAIEPSVAVGRDAVIHPEVALFGATSIGAGAEIHQGAWIRDSKVGEGAIVHPYSVLDGAIVEAGCRVGPFARLRPGATLRAGARVGNFVEVKNSELGERSRAGHLAYLGDAAIGADVNVGAGVVTVNYDGDAKHRTEVGAGAFVGSDTMLVAPLAIGAGAQTAAGSVITRDVPAGALAIGRVRQKNLEGGAERLRRARRARSTSSDEES